jgi:hypothetical protein
MPRLRDWWPAMAWAAAIWLFSTQLFSAQATSHYFYGFVRWLYPGINWPTFFFLEEVARGLVHFGEYFVFSLLVLRGVRSGRAGWEWTWGLAALAVVAVYAAADEVHQLFVPGRVGSLRDVLTDVAGGLTAQAWAWRRASQEPLPNALEKDMKAPREDWQGA